jgi:hypothetical protein
LMAIDGLLILFGYFPSSLPRRFLLWIAAFIMARSLRKSDPFDFSPRYKAQGDPAHPAR